MEFSGWFSLFCFLLSNNPPVAIEEVASTLSCVGSYLFTTISHQRFIISAGESVLYFIYFHILYWIEDPVRPVKEALPGSNHIQHMNFIQLRFLKYELKNTTLSQLLVVGNVPSKDVHKHTFWCVLYTVGCCFFALCHFLYYLIVWNVFRFLLVEIWATHSLYEYMFL